MEVTVNRCMLVPFIVLPPPLAGPEKKGKIKRKKKKHSLAPIYWLHTMHPNILGEMKARWGLEWGEWIDRECCQGLLLDSVVISEKKREKTKRKFTGVVLSGKALKWEAHGGWDSKSKEKGHSEEKEELSKVRQSSEVSCHSSSQSRTHTDTLCPWLKVIPGSWSLALIRVRALERDTNDPESCLSGFWCSLICSERDCHWDGNWMWPLIKHSKRFKNRTGSRQPIRPWQKIREIERARRVRLRVNPPSCVLSLTLSDEVEACGEKECWARNPQGVGWREMRGMPMRVPPPPTAAATHSTQAACWSLLIRGLRRWPLHRLYTF